jgi:hypothetical protein
MVPIPNPLRGGLADPINQGAPYGLGGAPDGPGALVRVRSIGGRVREAF